MGSQYERQRKKGWDAKDGAGAMAMDAGSGDGDKGGD